MPSITLPTSHIMSCTFGSHPLPPRLTVERSTNGHVIAAKVWFERHSDSVTFEGLEIDPSKRIRNEFVTRLNSFTLSWRLMMLGFSVLEFSASTCRIWEITLAQVVGPPSWSLDVVQNWWLDESFLTYFMLFASPILSARVGQMKPGDSKDENGLKRLIRICTPASWNSGKPVFPNKKVPNTMVLWFSPSHSFSTSQSVFAWSTNHCDPKQV